MDSFDFLSHVNDLVDLTQILRSFLDEDQYYTDQKYYEILKPDIFFLKCSKLQLFSKFIFFCGVYFFKTFLVALVIK